jgi:hypothetical protein
VRSERRGRGLGGVGAGWHGLSVAVRCDAM